MNAGENALLNFTLQADNLTPIPLAEVKLIRVEIIRERSRASLFIEVVASWEYNAPDAPAPANTSLGMAVSDGLVVVELLSTLTRAMAGPYGIRVSVGFVDAAYIASGNQVDVLYQANLLQIDAAP